MEVNYKRLISGMFCSTTGNICCCYKQEAAHFHPGCSWDVVLKVMLVGNRVGHTESVSSLVTTASCMISNIAIYMTCRSCADSFGPTILIFPT